MLTSMANPESIKLQLLSMIKKSVYGVKMTRHWFKDDEVLAQQVKALTLKNPGMSTKMASIMAKITFGSAWMLPTCWPLTMITLSLTSQSIGKVQLKRHFSVVVLRIKIDLCL